jgi:polysaccharide export outer membrane protein
MFIFDTILGKPRAVIAAIGMALAWGLASIPAAQAQQPPDYPLHPGDKIEISVWKEVDLQRAVIIRPDGKFSFPLTGDINANGRTVAQIQDEVAAKLKKYMPEPVVTVSVTEIGGNTIYVIGQVAKSGAYVMNPQVNVLQALSMAGGMTPFAAVNDISIIRGVKGNQKVMPFKFGDVNKGRSLEQNVMLEAGDVVVVP